MQLIQTASNYKTDLLNSKCLMSISDFASNCFTWDSQLERMPYLAAPEALDSSTHSSSTDTHSRAKMNTPAPTPSTVPAIPRGDSGGPPPCAPHDQVSSGLQRRLPATHSHEGIQTNTESLNSVQGIF